MFLLMLFFDIFYVSSVDYFRWKLLYIIHLEITFFFSYYLGTILNINWTGSVYKSYHWWWNKSEKERTKKMPSNFIIPTFWNFPPYSKYNISYILSSFKIEFNGRNNFIIFWLPWQCRRHQQHTNKFDMITNNII